MENLQFTKLMRAIVLLLGLTFTWVFSGKAQSTKKVEGEGQDLAQQDTIKPKVKNNIGYPTRYKKFVMPNGVEYRTFCKNYLVLIMMDTSTKELLGVQTTSKKDVDVRGNILYDFNYRSLVDTPFAQQDFQQHYLQANFLFMLQGKFPLQVRLTTKQTNSPYFKDYRDVALVFSQADFLPLLQQKFLQSLDAAYKEQMELLQQLRGEVVSQKEGIHLLEKMIHDPGELQRVVEAKEYLVQSGGSPVLPKWPSASKARWERGVMTRAIPDDVRQPFLSREEAETFLQQHAEKVRELDSMTKRFEELSVRYNKTSQLLTSEQNELKRDVGNISNPGTLKSLCKKTNHLPNLSAMEKFVLGLRSFSVGRSPVDYSDLTTRNISITGINLEYNANYYYALAVGGLDYRFRDYSLKDPAGPKQYLALFRLGKGDIERNHLVFTFYKGRKVNYNFSNPALVQQTIYGISAEHKYVIRNNHVITAELAKSSTLTSLNKPAFQLSDKSALAFSLKINSRISATKTLVSAAYRFTGANFQSFSLYRPTASQNAWNISVSQSLFRNTLTLQGALRQNEMANPYTTIRYKSQLLFKSLFLSFRKRHLPYVSLGYLPSSQLTKIDNALYENQFYTLTATVSHFYSLFHLNANTVAVFSQYRNNAIDTGFMYFNAQNFIVTQNLSARSLGFSLTYSTSRNVLYRLRVLEQGLSFHTRKQLRVGVGIKVNKLNKEPVQLSYYNNVSLPLGPRSTLTLNYDTSFLPGLEKTLVPNKMGHLSFYKQF